MLTSQRQPVLEVRGIRKRFGGILALDGVSLDVLPGEVHALVGENGAGKSTLINILGGILKPDEGEIFVDGERVRIRGVSDAEGLGIRLIHQELSLAPNLSVAENIFLGREPVRFGLLDRRGLVKAASDFVRDLGLAEIANVQTRVGDLGVAHQQLVEIARALSVRARVLILDEPTASLSEAETVSLFARLRQLRQNGVGIIYISHRLEEIRRLADRITVLRDGRSVGSQSAGTQDTRQLIRWMVGRELSEHYPRPPYRPGNIALRVQNLRSERIDNVSFELRYGEILGFAGLVGAGRTELARALFGIDEVSGGTVEVDGQPLEIRSPSDALRAGIVLVPENRKLQGLVMTNSAGYNLALPWTRDWIRAGCFPSRSRRSDIISRAITGFGIRTADPEQAIGSLSGGNQQKVVVARWMEHPPKVLILDEPTRGVDVGARGDVPDSKPSHQPGHGSDTDILRSPRGNEPIPSPSRLSRPAYRARDSE